jgi:hypothetical protein
VQTSASLIGYDIEYGEEMRWWHDDGVIAKVKGREGSVHTWQDAWGDWTTSVPYLRRLCDGFWPQTSGFVLTVVVVFVVPFIIPSVLRTDLLVPLSCAMGVFSYRTLWQARGPHPARNHL